MTKLGLFGAAATILSSAPASPVMAQQDLQSRLLRAVHGPNQTALKNIDQNVSQ
jgi:hypothetical protein